MKLGRSDDCSKFDEPIEDEDCACRARPRLWPPSRPMADMCARSRLTASPPFRPATRASSEVNSCAVPLAWAARPPLLAISRCLLGSIDAKPRLLVLAMCLSFGVQSGYCGELRCPV